MIALDLSASMAAGDMAPNRVEKAKFAIAGLIDRLEGDRVGLVAFAGEAFVQSPLDPGLWRCPAVLECDGARHHLGTGDQPRTGDHGRAGRPRLDR